MTTVILAEKPSQAVAYAETFQRSQKKDGYFQVFDSLFNDETYITFGFGHLVELVPPQSYDDKWATWSLENLPIFPIDYQYVVPKDKKKQFGIVSRLLNQATTIIIATDSDREGSNIAWSIIHEAGAYDTSKTYKRLWINSLEKEAIRKGFEQLRSGKSDLPAYKEAQTRQISDWLIGMNASPLYTLSLQKKNISGVFSIGRVQTPTLYMIYQRQKAIDSFVKTPYLEIEGDIKTEQESFKGGVEPSQRFKTDTDLTTFLQGSNVHMGENKGTIMSVETTNKQTNSPSLFSLSSLQKKANALFKISAKETLKIVQSLYEAKLLTYPRTDTPYITNNEFAYLKEHCSAYLSFLGINDSPTQTTPRKKYVNDNKVQEHHAIILTKQVPTKAAFEKLSRIQQNIYLLVARTTVAMFLADYQYKETIIETAVGSLKLKSKGQVPINKGWRILFDSNKNVSKEEENLLPDVHNGQVVRVDIKGIQKETQPPKLFTEGSIIIAMKTAGKTVDDEQAKEMLNKVEGIGTEATRADVIETLKKREYIESKKNQLLITTKGILLCEAIQHQQLLTSPEMTAKWEVYLKKIGENQGTQEIFLANIKKFISHLIEAVPQDVESLNTQSFQAEIKQQKAQESIGTCPKCGHDLVKKKGFIGCVSYPTCTFTLSMAFRGKKLTQKNLTELLRGQETIVTKIKKKDSKKTYNAKVKLSEKGFVEFIAFSK